MAAPKSIAKAQDPATTQPTVAAPNVAVESVNISAASPAYTGANSKAFAAVGTGLFGAGALLVLTTRRRRPKAL